MHEPRPSGPPVPSARGCLFPLLGAVCGALAVMWWQYETPPERLAFSQFDQTPSAVGWLAFLMGVGATVGFVVGVLVAKCGPGRSATREG